MAVGTTAALIGAAATVGGSMIASSASESASNAQANSDLANIKTTAEVNNPNYITPTGTQTTDWVGNQATVTQELSPEEQAVYDLDVANREKIGSIAATSAGQTETALADPMDFAGSTALSSPFTQESLDPYLNSQSLTKTTNQADYDTFAETTTADPTSVTATTNADPTSMAATTGTAGSNQLATVNANPTTMQATVNAAETGLQSLDSGTLSPLPADAEALRQQVIDAEMTRVDADYDQQTAQVEAELAAAGIPVGSEAWNAEMDSLNQGRNDAYAQAELNAQAAVESQFNIDLSTRQQGQSEQSQTYEQQLATQQADQAKAETAFNQGMTIEEFDKSKAEAAFNQGMSVEDFNIQKEQQAYDQQMRIEDYNLAKEQQAFSQSEAVSQYNLDVDEQLFSQRLDKYSVAASMQAQEFDQSLAARTQDITETITLRDQSLNELSAILGGTSVSNPFSGSLGYQASSSSGGTPVQGDTTDWGKTGEVVADAISGTDWGNILGDGTSTGNPYETTGTKVRE